VWPLVLLAVPANRRAHGRLARALSSAVALSALEAAWLWARGASWARLYYAPDTHAAPLLVGCIAGLLWTWNDVPRWVTHRVAAPAASGFVLLALCTQSDQTAFAYVGGELAVAVAVAVVVLSVATRRTFVSAVAEWGPLRAAGKVSYGLYLWHPFVLAVAARVLGRPPDVAQATLAVVVAIGLAAASYRFIEAPILGRAKARSRGQIACQGRNSAATSRVRRGSARQERGEELAGVARLVLGDDLGRALHDDVAAAVAAFGTEVDDPVGGLDDVEVVLDHEHGVALVDEA
jgi:peptidoglycan/LPS O-acetylase OafA/YrhL